MQQRKPLFPLTLRQKNGAFPLPGLPFATAAQGATNARRGKHRRCRVRASLSPKSWFTNPGGSVGAGPRPTRGWLSEPPLRYESQPPDMRDSPIDHPDRSVTTEPPLTLKVLIQRSAQSVPAADDPATS